MGIPISKRLRKRSDFHQVRSKGLRVTSGPFILQCHVMDEKFSDARRLGVIASRRVGNAVKRNRGKRLVRELFRANESALPFNCDLVVILRSSFDRYTFDELKIKYLRACMEICRKTINKR